MAMGRRAKERRQEPLWIAHTELPRTVAHPFYQGLNQILEERGFDAYVERQCAGFYAERMGRPSLVPGRYFRLLLIGYFEGIEGERGIAWRAADSLALRNFLGMGLDEQRAYAIGLAHFFSWLHASGEDPRPRHAPGCWAATSPSSREVRGKVLSARTLRKSCASHARSTID